MIIIYANLVGHTSIMLHTVIGLLIPKKIFKGFLPYMGVVAILVMWPGIFEQNLIPHLMESPYDFGWLVLLLYVPSQQLWSLRDGQFT